MKTLPGLLLATALALATATGASAYSLSPPDASVHLHGKLTFTPDEYVGGNKKPFTCSVTLELKTKTYEIKAVKFPRGECEGLEFVGLPWYVGIDNANSGRLGSATFSSSDGNCDAGLDLFQINGSGIWTLPAGQCLSGTLTSNPPTTIVP